MKRYHEGEQIRRNGANMGAMAKNLAMNVNLL